MTSCKQLNKVFSLPLKVIKITINYTEKSNSNQYKVSLLSSSTCNAFDFSSSPSCLLANLTALEERQVYIMFRFSLYWCLWALTECSLCSLSFQLKFHFHFSQVTDTDWPELTMASSSLISAAAFSCRGGEDCCSAARLV